MACNSYRIINNENYQQTFSFDDCDGYGYNVIVQPNASVRRDDVGTVLSFGTLTLEFLGGDNPPNNSYSGPIKYYNSINWGEAYEASYFHYATTSLANNFGIIYAVEENSDAWQYQLTDFDIENSTWNEL